MAAERSLEGLVERNRKLELQLQRNEWYWDDEYAVHRCPECANAQEPEGEGHEKGCKLKELLDAC